MAFLTLRFLALRKALQIGVGAITCDQEMWQRPAFGLRTRLLSYCQTKCGSNTAPRSRVVWMLVLNSGALGHDLRS